MEVLLGRDKAPSSDLALWGKKHRVALRMRLGAEVRRRGLLGRAFLTAGGRTASRNSARRALST